MRGDEINEFSFELYDKSGDGLIDQYELRYILTKIHGHSKHIDENVKSTFAIIGHKHSLYISKSEYLANIKHISILVFPLFAIQERLREVILGVRYWICIEDIAIRYTCVYIRCNVFLFYLLYKFISSNT